MDDKAEMEAKLHEKPFKDENIDIDGLKDKIAKLKSENAKLWHQNDAMAEAGLKRMAKHGF